MLQREKEVEKVYQKELEAENLAKNVEIKTLRDEVDRLSNSRAIKYVVSSENCSNCRNKDS